MPLYEHIYLARQDVSPQQVEELTTNLTNVLTEGGGKVTKNEYWGLKSLSYRIKKNRKAHYSLLNIDAPAPAVRPRVLCAGGGCVVSRNRSGSVRGARGRELRRLLAQRDGARCFYCRRPFRDPTEGTLDHYLPWCLSHRTTCSTWCWRASGAT